jgi:CRISPR-associated endonuclease/helicase Cas3
VTVYEPVDSTLPGRAYQQATQKTKAKLLQWLDEDPAFNDLSLPERVREYFTSLYSVAKLAKPELDIAIKDYDFPAVREHYRLIDQDSINIVVPYAPEIALYQQLKDEAEKGGISRSWILRARPITVSEFRPKLKAAIWAYLQPLQFRARRKGPQVQVPDWFIYLEASHYHPHLGLIPPQEMPEFII